MCTNANPSMPRVRDDAPAASPPTGGSLRGAGGRSARRRVAAGLLGLLAVWTLTALAGVPAHAADEGAGPWPQFGRDATHAGASPFDSPAPPFRRAWRFAMPHGERALSYPIVAGDTAIAAGKLDVYGVNLATGELRWRVPRKGGTVGAIPAVADVDGTPVLVFTEGGTPGTSALVAYSLKDPASPELLWKVGLEDRTGSGVSVDGDTAFVGDASGNVIAVRLVAEVRSGNPHLIRWQTTVPGIIDTPPAAGGGRVVVAARSRTSGQVQVASLTEESGKVVWTYAPSTPLNYASGVTLVGDRVLVGFYGDNTVVALSADHGAKVWTTRTASQFFPYDDIAVAGGYAYAMPSQFGLESGLYRVEIQTGRIATPWNFGTSGLWSFEFDVSAFYASPVVVGGTVVVGLDDGRLAAIDAGSGVLVWRTDAGHGPIHGIAAVDGTLVVSISSRSGGLVGLVHDPSGALLSEVSSTKPNWGRMLLDYGLAFVLVGVGAALLAVVLKAAGQRRGPEVDEGEAIPAEEPA
jgi:outer membrane protein assembly factor BamB